MPLATLLLVLFRALLLISRHRLALENLALRQQLAVLKRKVPHPGPTDRDRRFWLLMRALHDGWKECLHLVQPDTVIRWHRKGWRSYWRRKSRRRRPGRPAIGYELMFLIKRMQRENPLWGAPRITSELRLLGHDIGQSTVSRYMKETRDPAGAQRWRTFLSNHVKGLAACDFFVVPTVFFQRLFVLVVLSHDRRLIRHVAVTAHPTAEWTARQLCEAFPEDEPTHLIHDNDGAFRGEFRRKIEAMGITDVPITPGHWLQNAYCERVIGTLRRECTDHVIALNERHLLGIVREYVEQYYNVVRPHLSLERNAPIARQRETTPATRVKATPVLGELHHRYERAA
jgi:transposase InsO family protein